MRVLDSLGCAIGAVTGAPIDAIRRVYGEQPCHGSCTLIGFGSGTADRAAFFNTALVRYLDFMDSFMSTGETCHPSDNLGAVLAAAEYANASGSDFLAALAAAYHIQCALTAAAPVMHSSFDHTVQLAYSAAAGVARALRLNQSQASNAIAIAGASLLALAASRTGVVPQWKGLASAQTGAGALSAALFARQGITGPLDVIEGVHGFEEAFGKRIGIHWAEEGRDGVLATSVKRYNAEVHSQSAIEGVLALRNDHRIEPAEIDRIDITIFQNAYDIIGGGKYGDRQSARTKEQADHSLPYLIAVALLDGDVLPAQLAPARVVSSDVQSLMKRVFVRPSRAFTAAFAAWLPCSIEIRRTNGSKLSISKKDYEGFYRRPMTWDRVLWKFHLLATPHADSSLRRDIVEVVRQLEYLPLRDLTATLQRVHAPSHTTGAPQVRSHSPLNQGS